MTSRSEVLRLLLRLIGPVFLILIIWKIEDKAALWGAVQGADWRLLGVAAPLILPMLHLKIVRWRGLLARRGYHYPLRRSYAAVLSSMYLGVVTPGRVGDVLRIQYVRHEIDTPYAEGLAVTIMDRFCDLYVLGAVAAVGAVHFAPVLPEDLVYATWLAVAIALLAPLLLLAKGPAEMFGVLLRRFAKRWHASFDELMGAMRALARSGLVMAIALTVAAFVVIYAHGWLISRAMGIELSYLDVAGLLSATSLLGLMPISISGVGVRELFLALVFPALGLLPAQGVAFGLLVFLFLIAAPAVVGFIAWQVAPPPFEVSDTTAGRNTR